MADNETPDYPNPSDVTDAGRKAEDESVATDASPRERRGARRKKLETAEQEIQQAVESATDGKSESGALKVKTTDDGRVIGLDGENPVSNENPDPRAVRGVRLG